MNVSFTEVEDIFKSYEVWVGGKEIFWYKKAWNALENGGLTSYSNSISKNEVVIRSFALILIYQEFCQLAFDEGSSYYFDNWEGNSSLNAFKLGQIDGKNYMLSDSYDETWKQYYDKFGDEEEFQMILDRIFMDLIKRERYNVFFCLSDNIGGRECTIFVSMYLTCFEHHEDTNLENNYKIQDDNVEEISDYEKYERYIDKYYEQTLDLCEEMEAFQWVLAGADALE